MYRLIIKKSVYKFINGLENSSKYLLKLEDLKFFKTNQVNLDIKMLKGKTKGFYRLRIGKIRFIFYVLDDKIVVDKADFRGNIYN